MTRFGIRTREVETFYEKNADVLIAPLMAIQRGFNILDEIGNALLGSAFFMVRPYPPPHDLTPQIMSLNAWYMTQLHHHGRTVIDTYSDSLEGIEECQIDNPTLLMIADANLRKYFDELQDVSKHNLSLFGILDDNPSIRLARLRYSTNGDAPFCIPPTEKSKYQGLYAHDGAHVFYSVHNIGKLHKLKSSRKLDYLKRPSSNPSTMMIQLCNLQADDDPTAWASLPHRLRLAHEHIDTATVFPQPLHDLEAIKKYIPRYYDLIEDDDLNAIEEMED